jgi:hypothetical protein
MAGRAGRRSGIRVAERLTTPNELMASDSEEDAGKSACRTLGLPLHGRTSSWLAVCALTAYYVASMSRDLSLYDSGELALAAVQLGLGHPPGQPLHTLLGFLGSRLAFWSAPFGANLASALPAGLTVLPAVSLAQTLAGPRLTGAARRQLPWLIGVMGAQANLWEPATRVEVYALAALCAVWGVASAMPALLGRQHRQAAGDLFRAGLALGLCASANPAIAVATAAALGPGLLRAAFRHELPWSAIASACGGGVLGLLPYAYLPLTAARSDVFVWGGLHGAASYWHYLTLRDYAHNQTISLDVWLTHAWRWFEWAARQLLLPWLVLGLAGHLRASGGRSVALLLFAFALALISFNVNWNLDVPDYNGYLAAAYWVLAAGAGAFAASALSNRQPVAALTIAACLLSTLYAAPTLASRTRHLDHLARALAEQVLREAPSHAIVIAFADHVAGTLFYLQEVERARPDVVVLAYGLGASSWHWQRIQRLHPDLRRSQLQGPGGRLGRVQRFLAANPERPVIIERLALARELERASCPGGLFVRTGALCDGTDHYDAAGAKLLASQLALLNDGSPSALDAIADVSYGAGEALWRLGRPREAHAMLLAGVARARWPAQLGSSPLIAQTPAWNGPASAWQRSAALGDPARNLFLAGAIVDASGQSAVARGYLRAAARAGLPEAEALLASTH